MADTAIATDIHQSLDVELNERTALALYLQTQVSNRRTNCTYLLIGPILNLDIVADTGYVENLASRRTTNTEDLGQTDLTSLIFG